MLSGSSLLISDSGSNRILIWNRFPTTGLQGADTVLGQPDLRSRLQNNGALQPLRWLSAPRATAIAAGRLYIADNGNSRIVVTAAPAL
jgi:hypothetical protein